MPICLECGADKPNLAGHVAGKHRISLAVYIEKFKSQISPEELDSLKTKKVFVNKLPKAARMAFSSNSGAVASLSKEERKEYDDQVELLFEQSSRDPVLLPMIREIAMNQIFIARYQFQIEKMSSKFANGMDAKTAVEIHKIIQVLQKTNLENLESLNLTKAKKDALNKTPESTPSKMVSAFAHAVKLMTPEEKEKNKRDMDEAMNRLRHNLEELLTLVPDNEGEVAEEIEPVATD